MVGTLGLGAIALAGCLMDYFSWLVGGTVLAASLAAAFWFWRRSTAAAQQAASAGPKIESGLRIVEKTLPAKPRLPHGLRVTISTEVAVNLGLRIACDANVHEVEALVQTGRGTNARQEKPPAVRESRRSWLFAVRNSPVQRELFLRVDLYGAQPLHLQAVDLIRPGMAGALPEWRDLEAGMAAAAPSEAAPPEATPGEAAPAEATPLETAPGEAASAAAAAVDAGPAPDTSLNNPLP
jgi:hypothetical protein